MAGAEAEVNLLDFMSRRLTLTASTLRSRSVEQKAEVGRAVREHVWPRFPAGELRPVIHATWPLAEAAEAHRVLESSVHVGKLLLLP